MADSRLVENYCLVASAAMMWFDFAITFPAEVQGIWQRRLSGATLVYVGIRYTLLIERVVILSEALWTTDDKMCGSVLHVDDVLYIVNYFAVAALTALRVYAVTALNVKALVVVLLLSMVNPIVLVVETTMFEPVQDPSPIGCRYQYKFSDSTSLQYASLGASIAANSIVLLLTWWKTFSAVRASLQSGMNVPIAYVLVRNGTLYFLVMLFNLVMQVLSSSVSGTNAVFVIWPYFCEIFTAMILSRFILDLRLLLFEESDDFEPTTSELVFPVPIKTANVIGNLGATVRSHSAGRHGMRQGWDEDDEVPEFSRDPFKLGLKASLAIPEAHCHKNVYERRAVGRPV